MKAAIIFSSHHGGFSCRACTRQKRLRSSMIGRLPWWMVSSIARDQSPSIEVEPAKSHSADSWVEAPSEV